MHLPIGISNYRELITTKSPTTGDGFLFVDKSLLIKELVDDLTKVIIFTRPRRFGKTLNLSMLQHFFAAKVEGQPTTQLFNNLAISNYPEYMQEQGKYPVILISFKEVKQPTFELCLDKIKSVIAATYREFRQELSAITIAADDKKYIDLILNENSNRITLENSLKRLLELLTNHYHIRPILLIDEYDTPIQEAYTRGYYEELVPFFRNFLSGPLKDEAFLKRAILTGILRVSKESFFSGLNNVEIYSILHERYSPYFGFTVNETNELLTKANLSTDSNQTKEWFNGYNFGGITIYNPWSIIKFIKEQGELTPYWVNTSDNELIRDLLINAEPQIQDKIGQLIAGVPIQEIVDEHLVFQDLEKNRGALWSLLLMSGYLKTLGFTKTDFGKLYDLAIPNKEVEYLYKNIFREWLSGNKGMIWYQELLSSLTNGRIAEFEIKLQDAILQMASYYDAKKNTQEIFYQGLMLGLVSGLKDSYEIKSNRESGLGRYDLSLIPKATNKLGIVMEFKAKTAKDQETVEELAILALQQIKKSKYTEELKFRGVAKICCLGIGFSGKIIKVAT